MINIPEIKIKVSFKNKVAPDNLYKIHSAVDAYEAFKQIFNADTFNWKEEMILLCLNNANQISGFYKVSSGGFSSTVIDPRVIFSIALHSAASSIMIAHNHPSGVLKPSDDDIKVTKRIKEAGIILGITLIDHLILSNDGFYSFSDSEVFTEKMIKSLTK